MAEGASIALPFRLISSAVFVLCLCGCHADVTERIVANPDNSVTVTYREALDAQLYSAVAKIGGADPLRETSARNGGWKVVESVTAAGERVVSYSKTAPANLVQSLTLTSNNSKTVNGFDFNPASAFPFSIALSKISTGAQTIPALLYPDRVLTRPDHDPDAVAAAANAARNAGAVDSVVSVHLELKGPYRVTVTNGGRLAMALPAGIYISPTDQHRIYVWPVDSTHRLRFSQRRPQGGRIATIPARRLLLRKRIGPLCMRPASIMGRRPSRPGKTLDKAALTISCDGAKRRAA